MWDVPPPDPGLEIVVASRGYSKGLAQTEGVQVRAEPELDFGPVSASVYAKNVTSSTAEGEGGASLGVSTEVAGFAVGIEATWKIAIEPRGPANDDALELVGSVGRRLGRVNVRLGLTWSPDDLGGTGETFWTEAQLSYSLRPSTSVSAALGRRERDGGPDYTAFNFGVTQTLLPGVTADLRWHDSDRSRLGDPFEGRLVASLRFRM